MKEGSRSPWGKVDHVDTVAPGIWFAGTPGHGGYKLDAKRNKEVPTALRRKGGWYEEDLWWAAVAVTFPVFFEGKVAGAHETLKNWYPDQYEAAYGVKLELSESRELRNRAEYVAVKTKLLSYCAFGDWHAKVPTGKVGVLARVGGREGPKENNPERWFLVPKEEYENSSSNNFVVDPERHEEAAYLGY